MIITKDLSLKIMRYLLDNSDFYFPFKIMYKKMYKEGYCEIIISEEMYGQIKENNNLKNFRLKENLQDLDIDTTELMARGFIDKITNNNIIDKIAQLSKKYKKGWRKELWTSEDIEEFGQNEYLGGKFHGIEDCLKILKSK